MRSRLRHQPETTFAAFIKNPDHAEVLHIDVDTRVEPDKTGPRYVLLDEIYSK
jgi:hypothetical protein